jgi:DNA-binding transcriptional ArsR family regulator
MSLTNPLGDLPITDSRAMRALAHPVRLAILSYLQRNGPATATVLSPHVGATPSVTSWHLRHLAEFGLVTDADPEEVPGDRRQRWWKALARGFRFETTDDPASQILGDQLHAVALEQVDRWVSETRPTLDVEWLRVSGLSNTMLKLTADELDTLSTQIDEMLARYVYRIDPPPDARDVRMLRYYLPS